MFGLLANHFNRNNYVFVSMLLNIELTYSEFSGYLRYNMKYSCVNLINCIRTDLGNKPGIAATNQNISEPMMRQGGQISEFHAFN